MINPTAIDRLIFAFTTSLLFLLLVLSLKWTPSEFPIEDDCFLFACPKRENLNSTYLLTLY